MTLEEDFALLLDFAELLLESSLRELEELVAISLLLLDTLVSLLLDFGVTLEDDDCAELLDRSSPPSAELRAGSAEDDERTELLDRSSTGAEDDDVGVTLSLLDDVGSSSRGAKLLSSSQAAKNARANPSKKKLHTKNPPTLRCIFSIFSF